MREREEEFIVNPNPPNALSFVEKFLDDRKVKNEETGRRKKKDEHPKLIIYAGLHIFQGRVQKISETCVEITQGEPPSSGLHLVIERKDIVAVGYNKKEWINP